MQPQGATLAHAGDVAGGLKELKYLLGLHPQSVRIAFEVATVLRDSGDLRAARKVSCPCFDFFLFISYLKQAIFDTIWQSLNFF